MNLYIDVTRAGGIKWNQKGRQPWEIAAAESCVLDYAEREDVTLDQVGRAYGLTRERIRQLEASAIVKIRMGSARAEFFAERGKSR